jgi:hypothetical protein
MINRHITRLKKCRADLIRGYLYSLVSISTLLYTARMDSQTAEPTLEDVDREWPRWHCWKGVSGLLYASRSLTSPPAVVRGEDATDLRDQIRGWEGGHT